MDHYVVVCRTDAPEYEEVLATRRMFSSELGANRYASTVHPARKPRVTRLCDYLVSIGWRYDNAKS